ncbi:hypothetical protein SAMN03159453_03664 [Pseudomonas sp. NFIX28]|nr:hypothetical protein SAMN03159453_03664 [Pseudomonas sp. NFIX28]
MAPVLALHFFGWCTYPLLRSRPLMGGDVLSASVGARLARDGARSGAAFFGRGTYPFLRSRPLRVPPLRRVTFTKRRKSNQKGLPLRTAFAALRFPRSGVPQGASTPVGFASTSIRCPRLRRGALRAIPLMNASTRPPDGAGGSRSKAKAKAKAKANATPCATYRSALNPVAAAEPARLRSAAKRPQGLESAGGPSVLSQPAAAATGIVRIFGAGFVV